MRISRSSKISVSQAVEKLAKSNALSLDVETTGLRPYHGDRLFAVIIGNGEESYYFDFHNKPDSLKFYRGDDTKFLLNLLNDPNRSWAMTNAKFDLAHLAMMGAEVRGKIYCTRVMGRVLRNDQMDNSLAAAAKRIGMEKSNAVEDYIDAHELFSWQETYNGNRVKIKHFDKVPLEVMQPYAEMDAKVTYFVAADQIEQIKRITLETPEGLPTLRDLVLNEARLTRTVFNMERRGVLIDRNYCVRASRFEAANAQDAQTCFQNLTGEWFKASPKLFAKVFASEKDKWSYTEKGNPSFDSDALAKFENPAAKAVLRYRDAKSKSDFYASFLYHADADGVIHPSFNQDGTITGRFSSSEPNFQNLTSEEGLEDKQEFIIRRAIIPRPGYFFIMPDYDQMEYRMMLEYAAMVNGGSTELIRRVLSGVDVHQAMADLVKEVTGIDIGRSSAKNVNFAKLYGAGIGKLAKMLKCDPEKARTISQTIDSAAPEIANFCRSVIRTAETRGYVHTWLGRRLYFPRELCYKSPNGLIQGGCADANKVALNEIDEYLKNKLSKLVMTIHDENVVEVHESEREEVPPMIQQIMAKAFPSKFVPLTVGMEWSRKSLGDKIKGFPVAA